MSNTLTFHRIQYILFSGYQMNVGYVDVIVDGLVHTVSVGDFLDKIVVDEDKVYFGKNGHFYTIPGATLTPDFLA